VSHFLCALAEHHRPLALAEAQQLIHSSSKPILSPIQAWNKDYFAEKARASQSHPLSSSSHFLPPRLSLGVVFQALSELFSRSFGLRLRLAECSPGEVWDPEVRKLEVISEDALSSTGGESRVVGWIFADLFSRQGKQHGAAHYTVRCSRRVDRDDWAGDRPYISAEDGFDEQGGFFEPGDRVMTTMTPSRVKGKEGLYQLPISVLSCDFVRPSTDGGTTMLPWHEVETLFHEMGHALHCERFYANIRRPQITLTLCNCL
jgi:intermediate peptidase